MDVSVEPKNENELTDEVVMKDEDDISNEDKRKDEDGMEFEQMADHDRDGH